MTSTILTNRQVTVLRSLKVFGYYPKNWCVDTPEWTEDILERLVELGRVVKSVDGVYTVKEEV